MVVPSPLNNSVAVDEFGRGRGGDAAAEKKEVGIASKRWSVSDTSGIGREQERIVSCPERRLLQKGCAWAPLLRLLPRDASPAQNVFSSQTTEPEEARRPLHSLGPSASGQPLGAPVRLSFSSSRPRLRLKQGYDLLCPDGISLLQKNSSSASSASRRSDDKKRRLSNNRRESLSVTPSSKSRKATERKKSQEKSKEESKRRDLKYINVKREASDEAINLKKILKAEREEMPEIRKRELTTNFTPVHFPAGRIYSQGVLSHTIPVTPTETMITEMRERQLRTEKGVKGKAPRKYTGVTKATSTKPTSKANASRTASASKSRSNEGKDGKKRVDKSAASRASKKSAAKR